MIYSDNLSSIKRYIYFVRGAMALRLKFTCQSRANKTNNYIIYALHKSLTIIIREINLIISYKENLSNKLITRK